MGSYLDDCVVGGRGLAWADVGKYVCPSDDREGIWLNTIGIHYTAGSPRCSPVTDYDPSYPGHPGPPRISEMSPTQFVYADATANYIYAPLTTRSAGSYDPSVGVDTDDDGVSDTGVLPDSYGAPYNNLAPRHSNQSADFGSIDGSVRSYTLFEWIENTDSIWGEEIL